MKIRVLGRKVFLSTSKLVFPSCQGESTIFDNGNFHSLTQNTKIILSTPSFKQNKPEHTTTDYSWVNALIAVPCTWGLQAGINPPKERKERAMREGEREASTKGKGGLYNMPQNPTLPPKWPRSGVTFHFLERRIN